MAESRSQFTFYDSFYRALSRIRKKADRADAYDAIVAYALLGEEPELDKLSDAAAIAFEVIRPNLDASRRKAASGKQGGKAKKQTGSKPEANASTKEANRKQVKEQEQVKEQDKEQMLYTPIPPTEAKTEAKPKKLSAEEVELGRLPVSLREVMVQWLEYKKQRKDTYTPAGLTALVSEVINNANKYGEAAVAQVIRNSMASNYKGIVFDRLQQSGTRGRKEPIPSWVAGSLEHEAVKRMMATSGNNPEIAERAEKMKQKLGGM